MELRPLEAAHLQDQTEVGALLRQVKPDRDPMPLVLASLEPRQYSQVARDADGAVRGWCWGRPLFDGLFAWELRWLVVDAASHGQGVGRLLVEAFETWCRGQGILAVWLMTGEELGQTSLRGVDLWADPLTPLATIAPSPRHPFEFYQRLGYQFIGVIPDANGPGVPEYLMGKSLASGQ